MLGHQRNLSIHSLLQTRIILCTALHRRSFLAPSDRNFKRPVSCNCNSETCRTETATSLFTLMYQGNNTYGWTFYLEEREALFIDRDEGKDRNLDQSSILSFEKLWNLISFPLGCVACQKQTKNVSWMCIGYRNLQLLYRKAASFLNLWVMHSTEL